jgi:hypothetical protein
MNIGLGAKINFLIGLKPGLRVAANFFIYIFYDFQK